MKSVPKPAGAGKWEVVRRLRYGALIKLFRHRYGHEFPDDDAGRDDLFVLLCVVSLAPSATDKKMAHVIDDVGSLDARLGAGHAGGTCQPADHLRADASGPSAG